MHDANGPEEQKQLETDLESAERDLSEYRQALHRRIATASEELIARYREHPLDCLSAAVAAVVTGVRLSIPISGQNSGYSTNSTGVLWSI